MSPVLVLSIAGAIVFVGAVIQGSAGLGMNLISAPLLAMLDPALVPVPLLGAALLLSLLALRRELGDVDWRGVGLSVGGRIPGTALGVLAVALLPVREFSIAVGVCVLICVLLSVISWHPEPTVAALLTAGFAGGILGTSSSIGGPPVALLYQHHRGPRIRATLAAYFALGTVVSFAGLAIGGQIGMAQLAESLVLVPFIVTGFVLSSYLRRFLDAGLMRPTVLVLSGVSAGLLILRSLF